MKEMNLNSFIIENRIGNGSFEEQLFIRRVKATGGNECATVLSEAMKALQEKGLSCSEIKGAFEYAAATCGCFFIQQK